MAFRSVAAFLVLACVNIAAGHFTEECAFEIEEPCHVVEAAPCPEVGVEIEPVCPAPVVEVCPAPAPVCAAPVCPAPALPCYQPIVVQSVIPAPFTIGPQAPGVIVHHSRPYEINYFSKPWIIRHAQGASLNVFSQLPVLVDEYAHPTITETVSPAAVIVEEVCGTPVPCGTPAPCGAPEPCC